MALGDNTAFFNETTFGLADEQTTASTGISGIKGSDSSAAKVLFNKVTPLGGTSFASTSAKIGGVDYHLQVDLAYHGEIISIINSSRLSTQVTFSSAGGSAFQTASAEGFNSVGPTLRRLYHLGYV